MDTFSREALAAMPATLALIRDGRTVLSTQVAVADDFATFARSLREIAAELKEHDPDLERLLETGPYAAQQISALLAESGDEIGVLIADLLTVARIAEPRQAALQQILVTYPGISANAYTVFRSESNTGVADGTNTAHLGLVLNVFDPPVCVYDTDKRPGNELAPLPVPFGVKSPICPNPPFPGTLIRGEQNAPRGPAPNGNGSGNHSKRHGSPPPSRTVDMDGPGSILALP
jgi:phospholipid/cholesterol/gamma-HCH transport system substrate-binding protein